MTWWQDIAALIEKPGFEWLFKPVNECTAYNEIPIEYIKDGATVYGIIDRLLVSEKTVQVIDYKTHHIEDATVLQSLCDHYRPQLALYREGVERLWPGRQVKTWLLFTHNRQLVEI